MPTSAAGSRYPHRPALPNVPICCCRPGSSTASPSGWPRAEFITALLPDGIEGFLQLSNRGELGDLRVDSGGYLIRCGPEQIDLAGGTLLAPQAILINVDEIRVAKGTGTTVQARFRCHDDAGYLIQLGFGIPAGETIQPDSADHTPPGSPCGGDLND